MLTDIRALADRFLIALPNINTLFVRKFGKMMKKKGYHTRKRRDNSKNKEYVRLCYKCKSPDHIVADCPYNSDHDEHKKKNKIVLILM